MQKTERRKRRTKTDFLPKSVKFEPKMPPWGGVHQVTFFMVFGVGAPSGAQEASRGSPGVPRVIPSTNFDDLLSIWGGFWCDFGSFWCPSHNMNIKIWVAFSLRLKSARVSKFGQHSPSASSHKKVNTKIPPPPPAFEKCQGACSFLILPEYPA